MTIKKNTVVSLTYTLRDGGALGDVVEVADESKPLVFLYGTGMMLPSFEGHLTDLQKDSDFSFLLKAKEAYGEVNPEAIVEFDKKIFEVDGKIDPETMVLGKPVMMRDGQGHTMRATIVNISDDKVKLDFNPPMAGKDLHFTGKIMSVREATESEMEHGHVHGPGGHQH